MLLAVDLILPIICMYQPGSYNTFLGYGSASSAAGFTNSTAIGAYSEVGASNALVLGSINGVNLATTSKVGIGTITPVHFLDEKGLKMELL